MNKARRAALNNLNVRLQYMIEELEEIYNEEEYYYENIPENLKNSERANESEQVISLMQDVVTQIEEVVGNIEEIISYWLYIKNV